MRIAIVAEYIPSHQDGVGGMLFHLLEHLETHGHSSLLLTTEGSPLRVGRTQVVSVHSSWQTGEVRSSLQQSLEDFRPDIMHAIQPVALGVEAMHKARELGTPLLASYHSEFLQLAASWGFGMPGDLMWSYFRVLHDLANVSLVPTYFHQMQLRELGFRRTQTWARGVDCDLFSPKRRSSAWRRHLSDGEVKKTLLLYAGKLTADKHIELLRPVIERNPDCRLAIVGAGAESAWLRDYFEGTDTIFTGYLDQGDLAEVYASADAFIHPAATTISPVTTLEAMASGLPVLAPHSAAILDFAVHGENALLFIPGDTDQASAYVQELAAKPRLRTDLSRIARQTALGRNWHSSLEKLTRIYQRLIGEAARPLTLPAFESLPLPQVHN